MTDQELLQAMSEMMDQKLTAVRKDIMHDVTILMDADFGPRFKLLSEQMDIISERMDRIETKINRIEEKVTDHEIKLKIVE